MSRKFRLAAVLRARQAQEDAARAAVSVARLEEAEIDAERERRSRALAERSVPDAGAASSYLAVLATRAAMAGEVAVAERLAAQAGATVRVRTDDLAGAAIRRRTMDHLAERHAQERRKADEAAHQLAVDELASTRRPRRDSR